MGVIDDIRHPIVQAPMAGGPSTLELAAAVCDAGGLGFLAAGYRGPEVLREEIREMRGHVFGVNLFVPGPSNGIDEAALEAYVRSLGPGAGDPRWDDDSWRHKVDVLRDEEPVPVVSFTFGCPGRCEIASLRAHGSEVWVTVTSVDEARAARDAGADAVIAQGAEAGGHQGSWIDEDRERLGTVELVGAVTNVAAIPVIATGGIADAQGAQAALQAGAVAVQAGTAFMLAPEAGTHPAHREAIRSSADTAFTRAFTGRLARGIHNRFMDEHPDAPLAYPHINRATSPLRAAAREAGDAGGFNLWAGTAHEQAVERPAAETVRALAGL